jgi:hypothetical protein
LGVKACAGYDLHERGCKLMKQVHVAPLRVLAMALLAPILLVMSSVVVAQEADRPCAEAAAPADSFQSMGIGLTSDELVALYGEGEAGQSFIFYDFQGLDLFKDGCDLILSFPRDWASDEQGHEFALAESLLPADAEYAGFFARGTAIWSQQPASLWRSASLAERFAQMGENRSGEILILYTYQQEGIEPGPIQRIELRTLELPE